MATIEAPDLSTAEIMVVLQQGEDLVLGEGSVPQDDTFIDEDPTLTGNVRPSEWWERLDRDLEREVP